ncbi:MAG: dTDP-4-dehydrorhamnose 3,5-epimerase [Actinobacteria bacterium]|nr:dTDP-4-dehydrorhamnose 3,5-epimerase [Actinomycetota bacterium]
MKFIPTDIQDVIIIEPQVFGDERGAFWECYHQRKFHQAGITTNFIQDNHSTSVQGTLRGLHFQTTPYAQSKLVRAISGEIFDVAVDLRSGSETYGHWVSCHLSSENKRMLFIPQGFAHGFYVLSPEAQVHYKCDALYHPDADRCVKWDDTNIAIDWPLLAPPIVSAKDQAGQALSAIQAQ